MVFVAALFLASTRGAEGQVTYSYVGDPFTAADLPYTTSHRVTGSFDLAAPLPVLQALTEIGPSLADFSFSDGVQTRTPANTTVCGFQVATDAVGNIVQWVVSLREAPTPAPGNPQQSLESSGFGIEQVGVGPAGATACSVILLTTAASVASPGSWTSTLPPGTAATYSYLGQPFTAADPPYTTGNRVTGSILLGNPLPGLLPLTDIALALVDFSFTDGVQTRTPANTTVCGFQVATDAVGNIVQWVLSLREAPTPAPGNPQQSLESSGFGIDQVGVGPAGATACSVILLEPSAFNNIPGTWSRLLSPVEVPALGAPAMGILASALMLLALRALRGR